MASLPVSAVSVLYPAFSRIRENVLRIDLSSSITSMVFLVAVTIFSFFLGVLETVVCFCWFI